jgi:hypothetical protein
MHIQPTIHSIFDGAWDIFKKNIKAILIVTLIITVPINLVTELISSTRVDTGELMYLYAVELFVTLFGILALIAVALITKSAVEGKELLWQEALKTAINKWLQVLGTNILAGILLIPLFLLLIVPGIIFAVYWFFITYVVIFSNRWGISALYESKELVQNRWWKTFGFAVVFGILGLIIWIFVAIPSGFLPEGIIYSVIGNVPMDMVTAFTTVLGTIFYLAWDSSKIKKTS